MNKEQWEVELNKIKFIEIDPWDIKREFYPHGFVDNFLKEKLEQRDKEIINKIEQLKWEGRLTEQQKLDELIKYIND